jgi:glycosyltransferase involved in cell wall biosynthesis
MSKNILIITNSIYKSKNANYIQSSNMANALSTVYDKVFTIYKHHGNKNITKTDNITNIVLGINKNNFINKLRWVFIVLLQAIKINIKYRLDFIYGRKIDTMIILATIFKKKKFVLELHAPPKGINFFLLRYFAKNNLTIVVISRFIQKYLKIYLKKPFSCHVIPDCHNVPTEEINLAKSRVKEKLNYKIKKIGYFGSFNDYKASKVIINLIEHSKNYDFYIYSKEYKDCPKMSNIKECTYVQNNEALKIMKSMDCLLLTLHKRDNKDDLSRFTSPLKLFEYMASGVPIIASNLRSIREILKDETNSILFDNSIEGFISGIKRLEQSSDFNKKIVLTALNQSLQYTYLKRARFISNLRT